MSTQDNDSLPALSPAIQLYKAASTPEGEPRWTLHHKISNKYFQIGWAEFECLARFHRCITAEELIKCIERETTLKMNITDIQNLIMFLQSNGLVASKDQKITQKTYQKVSKPQNLWKTLLHGYLYFTIPLFQPESFLKRTLPYIEFAFSKLFLRAAFILLILGIVLTLQRPDEFLNTFIGLFTLEGAILTLITFSLIKILHELGHAYAAIRNGISVPHMGIAFMILYPMLYTETTAAWQISSPRKRMEIALAGVTAELVLSSVFLLLWNILPDGLLKSLCFNAVVVSLVGSLLINLNPLMRFDGYYVLSDFLSIENLHEKAIGFARWKLRHVLFNLKDPEPFEVSEQRKRFLIPFGFAVLIYRFFLFLGIALLVYHLFFKPLGLVLMILELLVFIILPIISELKIWWKRRDDIFPQKRSRIVIGTFLIIITLSIIPIDSTVTAPGILHSSQHRSFYSPFPAYITESSLHEGQHVSKGQILVRLESDTLEYEYQKAKSKTMHLETMFQRSQTNTDVYKQKAKDLEQELESARIRLKSLEEQKALLVLTAPFDGIIHDLSADIHAGRAIKPEDLLFRLLQPEQISVYGFIHERDFERLLAGYSAIFIPSYNLTDHITLEVKKIEPLGTTTLAWPELASVYKGPLPAVRNDSGEIFPLEPLYTVYLDPTENTIDYQGLTIPGQVHIQAHNTSPALSVIHDFLTIIRYELNLN